MEYVPLNSKVDALNYAKIQHLSIIKSGYPKIY